MSEAVINTENLHKIYGKGEITVNALAGVSVRVDAGEFIAVMGPSGSGKSTLMNILGCLDRPTEGTYELNGEEVSQLSRQELAHIHLPDTSHMSLSAIITSSCFSRLNA